MDDVPTHPTRRGGSRPPAPPLLAGLRPCDFLKKCIYNDVKVVKVFKVVKNSCNNVVVILDDGAGGAPPPRTPPAGRPSAGGAARARGISSALKIVIIMNHGAGHNPPCNPP